MMMTELLSRLLELTPPPPAAHALATEQLIAVFEAILEQRAEVIAQIAAPVTLTDDDREIWGVIERRQHAWQATLAAALQAVAAQRSGTRHLRSYAQHL